MSNNESLFQEDFKWESETQRKGYLALLQYLRKFGIEATGPVDAKAAFFIQKDHESNLWWIDLIAQKHQEVLNMLGELNFKVSQLESTVEQLRLDKRAKQ